jgi:BirA family biotin operon repressor/biotin-[acetyl-CoA-carboxylase] ligase
MLSVILRPAFPPERFSLVTLAGGVAVAESVAAVCDPLRVHIKWPNDVLIEGRKCCGMLLEASTDSTTPIVVLGIGLNVNQDTFPDALQDRATSLRLETGRPIDRAPLLADLLARLERWYDSISDDNGEALRAAYTNRLGIMGEAVTLQVTDRQQPVVGTVVGIDATGSVRLQTNAGVQTFHAGDVTFQPPSDA